MTKQPRVPGVTLFLLMTNTAQTSTALVQTGQTNNNPRFNPAGTGHELAAVVLLGFALVGIGLIRKRRVR